MISALSNPLEYLDYPIPDNLKPFIEIVEKEPENSNNDQYDLLDKALFSPLVRKGANFSII
ncbi:MAG: hypothetical protein H0V82_10700 [Candidatus Protochlamydia sp.]|nr:hypothetical protein [Candidatus Protochlamydia sp.]